jgi:hypothetical protein
MNSKQRRKWLRENEPKAWAEVVHRTLQGTINPAYVTPKLRARSISWIRFLLKDNK